MGTVSKKMSLPALGLEGDPQSGQTALTHRPQVKGLILGEGLVGASSPRAKVTGLICSRGTYKSPPENAEVVEQQTSLSLPPSLLLCLKSIR